MHYYLPRSGHHKGASVCCVSDCGTSAADDQEDPLLLLLHERDSHAKDRFTMCLPIWTLLVLLSHRQVCDYESVATLFFIPVSFFHKNERFFNKTGKQALDRQE